MRPAAIADATVKVTETKRQVIPATTGAAAVFDRLKDTVQHRTSKYLNNRIEADHGALKRLIRPQGASSR